MLLVPRSKEFFGPISVNALGFAGALLAKNQHEMKLLMEQGMGVLLHTAQPLLGNPAYPVKKAFSGGFKYGGFDPLPTPYRPNYITRYRTLARTICAYCSGCDP